MTPKAWSRRRSASCFIVGIVVPGCVLDPVAGNSPVEPTGSSCQATFVSNDSADLMPSNNVAICFVRDPAAHGPDAGTASDADWIARARVVRNWLDDWTRVSALVFEWPVDLGCLPYDPDADRYPGDVRILLDEGAVETVQPCVDGDVTLGGGWWASGPSTMASNQKCLFNVQMPFLGEPRNKYLHEVGHALGFHHEHQRPDRTCSMWDGTDNRYQGISYGTVLLTPFDLRSVMHYADLFDPAVPGWPEAYVPCTPANEADKGDYGLTEHDMLAAEIAYPGPDSNRIVGAGIVRAGVPFRLVTDHVLRGALTGNPNPAWAAQGTMHAYPSFRWYEQEQQVSTADQVVRTIATPGDYAYKVTYQDAWSRETTRTATVQVATPSKHTAVFSSSSSATL